MGRLVAQPGLLLLRLGGVADDGDEPALAVERDGPQGELDREGAAVRAHGPPVPAAVGTPGPVAGRPEAAEVGEELLEAAAGESVRPQAEHGLGGRIGRPDAAVLGERDHAVEALLHDVAHQEVEALELAAAGERQLGEPAVDQPAQLRLVAGQEGAGPAGAARARGCAASRASAGGSCRRTS